MLNIATRFISLYRLELCEIGQRLLTSVVASPVWGSRLPRNETIPAGSDQFTKYGWCSLKAWSWELQVNFEACCTSYCPFPARCKHCGGGEQPQQRLTWNVCSVHALHCTTLHCQNIRATIRRNARNGDKKQHPRWRPIPHRSSEDGKQHFELLFWC